MDRFPGSATRLTGRRVLAALVLLFAVVIGILAGPSFGAQGDNILVSRQSASDGGAGAEDNSGFASSSSDGRYIAFSSDANNLSTADDNEVTNVFVRDTVAETTKLVSRKSASAGGTAANDLSLRPSISADGRYVAFESDANNLSSHDNNAYRNIFVRDTVAQTTKLVSRKSASDGGQGGNDDSFTGLTGAESSANPSISAHGRYVAFSSDANNLSDKDNNAYTNIFLRDTRGKTTKLVSRKSASKGGQGANGLSGVPSLSSNGRYVAFESDADNLSATDDDTFRNIFVRDTQAKTTKLVSRRSASDGGGGANGFSEGAAISSDGDHVAFASGAENLSTENNDSFRNVYVRDIGVATTKLVSRQSASDSGTGADGISGARPSVSSDGSYVAFQSSADNLSIDDDNAYENIFARDITGNVTSLVSQQSPAGGGAGANESSFDPTISADGVYASFRSNASNLTPSDDVGNIFRHQVLP